MPATTTPATTTPTPPAGAKNPLPFHGGHDFGDGDFGGKLGNYGDDFGNSKFNDWRGGGFDSYGYDWKQRWAHYVSNGLTGILIVFVAIFVLNTIAYRKHDVIMWWRRRRLAAKYKRVKADAAGPDTAAELSGAEDDEDLGMLEIVTSSFTADKSVECVVDLGDGKGTHTCDAYDMEKLEKLSELPFVLAESCRRSGDVELAAVSLVDLYLKDRLRLEYTSASGEVKAVGKHGTTTPAMIRAAKSFRVTVLAPTTR